MKIHRFFDFRRQGAPFASQFLFVFYKSGRPLISDLVEAFINGKMSDFFPRGSAKGGPSFSRPAIGEFALQISSTLFCSKNAPEAAPIFSFFQTKNSPFHTGICFATKTKIPPRKCQSWSKKGATSTRAVWVENRRSCGAARFCPVVPDCAQPPDPARRRFLPRRSRGRHS